MTRSERLVFILLLVAFSIGCTSNKKFVADKTAERIYQEDRYERVCVQVKGPALCKDMQTILVTLLRHEPKGCDLEKDKPNCKLVGLIPLANEVQQVGEMPKMERKELKDLFKQLEDLP